MNTPDKSGNTANGAGPALQNSGAGNAVQNNHWSLRLKLRDLAVFIVGALAAAIAYKMATDRAEIHRLREEAELRRLEKAREEEKAAADAAMRGDAATAGQFLLAYPHSERRGAVAAHLAERQREEAETRRREEERARLDRVRKEIVALAPNLHRECHPLGAFDYCEEESREPRPNGECRWIFANRWTSPIFRNPQCTRFETISNAAGEPGRFRVLSCTHPVPCGFTTGLLKQAMEDARRQSRQER